ncbi:LOW QUALITY PROTEIN: Pol protein, partial [Phytophthora palmivora]
APPQSLPDPADCWKSRSLDFVIGLPADDKVNIMGVWDALFQRLGTKLTMSTADHPRTGGQTERVNCVLEDTICAKAPRSWSDELPMVEFELNNAVHASTGFTPFYLNGLRHPQMLLTLRGGTDASIRRNDVGPAQTKACSDTNGRENLSVFTVVDLVLLDTKNLPLTLVHSVGSNSLKRRFIGPVRVLGRHGAAYTIDLVKSIVTHPMSYMGRLKRYDGP